MWSSNAAFWPSLSSARALLVTRSPAYTQIYLQSFHTYQLPNITYITAIFCPSKPDRLTRQLKDLHFISFFSISCSLDSPARQSWEIKHGQVHHQHFYYIRDPTLIRTSLYNSTFKLLFYTPYNIPISHSLWKHLKFMKDADRTYPKYFLLMSFPSRHFSLLSVLH